MINKLKKFKKIQDALVTIVICLGGLAGVFVQGIQYFTGLWLLPFYQEVFILVFFFILALYPHKIVHLFMAVVYRVKNINFKNSNMNTDEKEKEILENANVAGDGQGSSNEEI